jgi:hypothetical protein
MLTIPSPPSHRSIRSIYTTVVAALARMPPPIQLGAHILLLVILFQQLWLLPERLGRFTPEMYRQPLLIGEWLRSTGALMTLAIWAALFVVGWRRLQWRRLEEGSPLRILVLLVAGGLTWEYTLYDLNAYLGQWHMADRLLLAALAALLVVHPMFVVPLLLHVRTLSQQFGDLIGAYSFTDKQIAFDTLSVFALFLVCRLLVRTPVRAMIILVSSMLGSHFLYSGWTKITLEWQASERLEFLFTSSHANGWLGGLDASTVAVVASILVAVSPVAKWILLFAEASPLLLFLNRRIFLVVVSVLLAMHVGVLALTGLLFWKWMLVEAGLLLFVLRGDPEMRASLFTPTTRVVSLTLMLAGPLYFRPAQLGWLDTAITHIYELEAVGRSGRVYPVPRGFMAPFDLIFSQNQFDYLVDREAAVTTYGATANPEIAKAVNALVASGGDVAEGFARIEAQHGTNRYSSDTTTTFDEFLRGYFGTLNRRASKGRLLLPPPHHIWNSGRAGAYDMQEPVTEVRMRRSTKAWIPSKGDFTILSDDIVRKVPIE